ncbi:MAG: oxygen-independent coproporphyrinogen III oxidase [Pseudomonadota bacterium]
MQTDRDALTALIPQLAGNGPRYTSYPTANLFAEGDFQADYRNGWETGEARQTREISVYIHVPFCATVCFYCACNKIHTANRLHTRTYLAHLLREIELQVRVTGRRRITQLHFGGGTPTTLSVTQMARIFEKLEEHYELDASDSRDFSIELDPRKVTPDEVIALVELGINRISIGVQDFTPAVQQAVNRIQTQQETGQIAAAARSAGVQSVSVDLIYGLPLQTRDNFANTLRETLRLDPDRIALYSYAHLPTQFKTQRQIKSDDLPDAATKLSLLNLGIEAFEAQGYRYLGMDHFARETDSLCRAQDNGTLQRNFMGYTTHARRPLLALGVSAIGSTETCFSQNHKTLHDYYEALDADRLPLARGLVTSHDDRVRQSVISDLMCRLEVSQAAFTERSGVPLQTYFAQSWTALEALADLGLVTLSKQGIRVTSLGRYFLRNICMCFDAYLDQGTGRFSRTV